jgi:hypothetical protein
MYLPTYRNAQIHTFLQIKNQRTWVGTSLKKFGVCIRIAVKKLRKSMSIFNGYIHMYGYAVALHVCNELIGIR